MRKRTSKAQNTPNEAPPTKKRLTFLNDAQRQAYAVCESNRVAFLLGSSGAGKTQIALAYAIQRAVAGEFEKVYITRPCVEAAGDALGFLPGAMSDKTAPYLAPAMQVAKKVGYEIPIEFIPIAFLRGWTFEDAVVVVEEAQNTTVTQLRLILSRLGPGSKIIFTGDEKQKDVRDSGLRAVARSLEGLYGVGIHTFTDADIVRDPMIGAMLSRLEGL